jgi:putative NADPH-quinone reductase|tara:strand:- start:6722 stop:7312 length:591 start_codon:yes stop_codon:yes gene_type:complete
MTKKKFKHLIVVGHPNKESFCYSGIYKTIVDKMEENGENYKVIDLYEDKLHRDRTNLIKEYQDMITWSTHIYFISPVWWFRLVPKMETFFDEVLTPGFAYKFVNITKLYAYPVPFLGDKKVRTYITHGAPMLPVITLYLNSVKLRLVLGVFTFVFGWKISRWLKTKQFWSVPFVSEEKRKKYLKVVENDIKKDLKL